LVHVHVELRAAAGHPDVQREHVLMAAGEDLVAGLRDQAIAIFRQPAARPVRDRRGLLEDRVGADQLARHQIVADVKVLERALRLRAPQHVGRNGDFAVAVGFGAHFLAHRITSTGVDSYVRRALRHIQWAIDATNERTPDSSISIASAVSTRPISRSNASTTRSPSSACRRCAAISTAVVKTIATESASAHSPILAGSRVAISMTAASADGPAIDGIASGTRKG